MRAPPDGIEQACARLVALYGYLNDARDSDAMAALFTVDAILYRPAAPALAIVGREAIRASFAARPAGTATFHVCTDVVIDVEDAEHAVGRSRILLLKEGGGAPLPGTFQDRFRLTGEGWRFSQRRGALWLPA
ncbi:MAG TPA: nuclear transport factor 2 family protein [Duganella sp.]|uniref:nuclear transport factor 2 family protein n=1 Tax=Duganella sp. TaxID=1904440 RepID=UPI002ED231F0